MLKRIAKFVVPVVALVPMAFGISIGLGKLAPEKAAATETPAVYSPARTDSSRIALVIGNSNYPDANTPLLHPVKDAQDLAEQLRRSGFDVDERENLGKDELRQAIESFKAKIKPGSTAFISFGGYGIQIGRQSYIVPVNAQIWKEADVRRDGVSIDDLLGEMHDRGATVKIAVLDASRRNPYERRFRGISSGLAAIDAPQGTLLLSAAAPGKVAYDGEGDNSLLIGELLKEMTSPGVSAEAAFNKTRIGVSRITNGEQVPLVSSSLIENFAFIAGTPRNNRYQQARPVETPKVTPRPEIIASRTDTFDPPAGPNNDTADVPMNTLAPQNVDVAPQKVAPAPQKVETVREKEVKPEKPAPVQTPAVEKHVHPKETKPAKVVEEVKRPRRPRDLEGEFEREQPRAYYGRSSWFNPAWRMAAFPRYGFGRPMMGMGF